MLTTTVRNQRDTSESSSARIRG
nr:unnamed protein product [Callosobruchus chinensis]